MQNNVVVIGGVVGAEVGEHINNVTIVSDEYLPYKIYLEI